MKEYLQQMLKAERDYAHNQLMDEFFSLDICKNIPFNNNPSDVYHNREHCLDVAYLAMQMSRRMFSGEMLYIVSRQAILAALFHDAYHSLGKETDDVNVAKSVLIFEKYCKDNEIHLERREKENIKHAILSTEFPHKELEPSSKTSEEVTVVTKILCDADLSSSLSPGAMYNSLYGLAKESGNTNEVPLEKYLQFIEILPNMLKIEKNRKWVLNNQETMKKSVSAMYMLGK